MIWSAWEKQRFRELGYHGIFLLAASAPVAVLTEPEYNMLDRTGVNMKISDVTRLSWPCRVGVTASLTDNQTSQADCASPHHDMRVRWRLWAKSRSHAEKMQKLAQSMLRYGPEAVPMRRSWIDAGCHVDFLLLQFAVHSEAKERGIPNIDDDQMHQVLSRDESAYYRRETQIAGAMA